MDTGYKFSRIFVPAIHLDQTEMYTLSSLLKSETIISFTVVHGPCPSIWAGVLESRLTLNQD